MSDYTDFLDATDESERTELAPIVRAEIMEKLGVPFSTTWEEIEGTDQCKSAIRAWFCGTL